MGEGARGEFVGGDFGAAVEDFFEAGVVFEAFGVELHVPEEGVGVMEELVVIGVLRDRLGKIGVVVDGREEIKAECFILYFSELAFVGVEPVAVFIEFGFEFGFGFELCIGLFFSGWQSGERGWAEALADMAEAEEAA